MIPYTSENQKTKYSIQSPIGLLYYYNMERTCVICGELIPVKRLKILPNTNTCVQCSSEPKKSVKDIPGKNMVQHTGGLHEKYLKEEDIEDK